jgi:peptidoglycan/LPS O-acetylase OafA/YrhL
MKLDSTTSVVSNSSLEGRLRELDGWRAISVLLVIVDHILLSQHRGLVSGHPALQEVVRYLGILGVDIFFVISGFVIFRLLISEEARSGTVSLKAFYYRRIFRILPPFYVYLTVAFLLFCLGFVHESRTGFVSGALFLQDLHLVSSGWFTGHAWSLAVEEQFYLLFPVLWVLTPKRFKNQVFLVIFFASAAWNLSLVYTGWDSRVSGVTRAGFVCISCGVLLAIYEARARSISKSVPAFVVAIVGLTLVMHPVSSQTWQAAIYESFFTPPAIGLLLLFSLARGKWLRGFLCSKPVQAVGLTSYGIYLWQELFTAPKVDYSGSGKIIPMLLPLLLLVIPASYFLVEKPAIRFGKSLSQRRTTNTMESLEPGYEGLH